jgi:hypothetical protein
VTEEEFQKLVEELRPNMGETQHSTAIAPGIPAVLQSTPVAQAVAEQAPATNNDGGHEATDEGDDDVTTHPNDVFTEFEHAWRNVRPGGAFAKDTATDRPQQRRLDVLFWGFGG